MSAFGNLSNFFSNHPLTRDDPMRAWARFALWQIRSRIQKEVILPWIGGQRLAVRRGMTGATGNIYVGLHEFSDMMLALHFLRKFDSFLDIGANVGSYTVLAAGVSKATVLAFEPDPLTAVALKRNIEVNDLSERVTIYNVALGNRNGEVKFTRGLDTVNHVVTTDESNTRTVQMRQLDTLIGSHRPTMIKIDVEGHEDEVIRGAEAVLSDDMLKVIELETVTPGIDDAFSRHRFERAYYDPFARRLMRSPNDSATFNAVYVRDWDFVASRLATGPAVEVFGRSI